MATAIAVPPGSDSRRRHAPYLAALAERARPWYCFATVDGGEYLRHSCDAGWAPEGPEWPSARSPLCGGRLRGRHPSEGWNWTFRSRAGRVDSVTVLHPCGCRTRLARPDRPDGARRVSAAGGRARPRPTLRSDSLRVRSAASCCTTWMPSTGGPRNVASPRQLERAGGGGEGRGVRSRRLVTVDAEGGSVPEAQAAGTASPPTASARSRWASATYSAFTRFKRGRHRATMLADAGIDLNLAPVVDLLDPAQPHGDVRMAAELRSRIPDGRRGARPASSSWPIRAARQS
jgi:hypothetical protein